MTEETKKGLEKSLARMENESPFHTELDECTSSCRRVGCPEDCKNECCDGIDRREMSAVEWTEMNLDNELRNSRQEWGGISIEKVGFLIRKNFDVAEIESLIKQIK